MELFNQAILKQGWRILSDQTLSWPVLKGKYFPYGSFLQAREGPNPLWAWQSILWATNFLIEEFDGTLMMVARLHVRWIPTSFPSPPQVSTDADPSIFYTSQLIDERDHGWI